MRGGNYLNIEMKEFLLNEFKVNKKRLDDENNQLFYSKLYNIIKSYRPCDKEHLMSIAALDPEKDLSTRALNKLEMARGPNKYNALEFLAKDIRTHGVEKYSIDDMHNTNYRLLIRNLQDSSNILDIPSKITQTSDGGYTLTGTTDEAVAMMQAICLSSPNNTCIVSDTSDINDLLKILKMVSENPKCIVQISDGLYNRMNPDQRSQVQKVDSGDFDYEGLEDPENVLSNFGRGLVNEDDEYDYSSDSSDEGFDDPWEEFNDDKPLFDDLDGDKYNILDDVKEPDYRDTPGNYISLEANNMAYQDLYTMSFFNDDDKELLMDNTAVDLSYLTALNLVRPESKNSLEPEEP